jgi:hypothetical protein
VGSATASGKVPIAGSVAAPLESDGVVT